MVLHPGKPVPLSAAEAEAGKSPCGSLPLQLLHHVQLPFLKGREVINKLSLFFSKVRIGLGINSIPSRPTICALGQTYKVSGLLFPAPGAAA